MFLKKRKVIEGYEDHDPESLLKKANYLYPSGTKYYCRYGRKECEVGSELKFYQKGSGYGKKYDVDLNQNNFITDGEGGVVYISGRWADIKN